MDKQKFFRSFYYAFQGIVSSMKEQNMRIHLFAAIVTIVASIVTGLSILEWCIVIIVVALVIGAEMFNTAIEKVVDLVSPDFHPLAKLAKDIAAGAVLVFACMSVIIGILIFVPKWLSLF